MTFHIEAAHLSSHDPRVGAQASLGHEIAEDFRWGVAQTFRSWRSSGSVTNAVVQALWVGSSERIF